MKKKLIFTCSALTVLYLVLATVALLGQGPTHIRLRELLISEILSEGQLFGWFGGPRGVALGNGFAIVNNAIELEPAEVGTILGLVPNQATHGQILVIDRTSPGAGPLGRVVGLNIDTASLQLTESPAGTFTLRALSGTPQPPAVNRVYLETPSGAVDGVNPTFTVANSYRSGSLEIVRNGVTLSPGIDFNEQTPNAIVFIAGAVPVTSDVLRISYDRL